MIPYSVADKIAAAGRMKNLFETKYGRGSTDEDQRSGWEKQMYGIDPQTEAHLRPLYGFLNPHSLHHGTFNYSGLSHPLSVSPYGELVLDLKPEVKSRSTFINGDSSHLLSGSLVTSAGMPQLGMHLFDFDPTGVKRFLDGFEKGEYAEFPNGYAEAQIHGGVYPEDVAAIHFNWKQPHPSTLDLTNFANHYLSFDHVMNMKPGRLEQVEAWHPTKTPTPSKNHPVGRVLAFRAAKRLANAFGVPLHVHVVEDATRKRLDTKTFLPTAVEQPPAEQPDTESVTKSLSMQTFNRLQKSTREGISTFHNVVRPIAEANEVRLSGPDSSNPRDYYTSYFADILEKSPISMMIPRSVADKIAAAGRMKNLFETSEGRGSTHKGQRAGWEEEMYGIDGAAPAHMRPVYGFLNPHALHHDNRNFRGLPFPRSVSSYGEMVMDLKPHVKERSTFTNGDSAELERDSVVTHKGIRGLASHIANSVRRSVNPTLENFIESFQNNQAAWFPNRYAEAQIHGGVYPEDVAAIHFTWEHPSRIDPANPIHHYDVFKNVMKMTPEEFEAAKDKYPALAISRADVKIRGFHAAKRLANAFGVPLHVHVIDENDNRLDKKTFRPQKRKAPVNQMALPLGEPKMNPVTKSLLLQAFENLSKSTKAGIRTFHDIVSNVFDMNEQALSHPSDSLSEELGDILDRASVSIMLPYEVAHKVAKSGRFRNLFETKDGMGSTSTLARKRWENDMFSIDYSVPHKMRPIYGFLNPFLHQGDPAFGSEIHPYRVGHYGTIMVDLKPDVKNRSTFTHGDSGDFTDHQSVVSARGLQQLAHHMFLTSPTKGFLQGLRRGDPTASRDYPRGYTEAQIHGGVYPEDVAGIHMVWEQDRVPSLKTKADAYHDFGQVARMNPAQLQEVYRHHHVMKYNDNWRGSLDHPMIKVEAFRAAKQLANKFGVPLHVHVRDSADGSKIAKKTFLPKGQKPESPQMALPFAKSEFDPKELEMGIEVELEHTDDRKKAEEIAREHLAETPDYYSKMKECGLSKGKISGLIKSMFGGRDD
jgi:hypothetical protein